MGNNIFIPDANIFLEIIFKRSKQHQANLLIERAISNDITLIAPSILLDEITEVLCGNVDDMDIVNTHLSFLERLVTNHVLNLIIPDTTIRTKAIEIARIGNKKSGYPDFIDSLYHAVALLNNGTFLTHDNPHFTKTKHLTHIQNLNTYI